jgi:hypothetical protein
MFVVVWIVKYYKSLKIPKGYSEDTKGVFRRYQGGIQKKPKGYSEDIKGVFRR